MLKGTTKPQNVNRASSSFSEITERRKLAATVLDRIDRLARQIVSPIVGGFFREHLGVPVTTFHPTQIRGQLLITLY
jgi:hypothetical protein